MFFLPLKVSAVVTVTLNCRAVTSLYNVAASFVGWSTALAAGFVEEPAALNEDLHP